MNELRLKSVVIWGLFLIAIAPALCYLAWEIQTTRIAPLPAIAGPLALAIGLASVSLPLDKLMRPSAFVDGQPVFDNDAPKFTTLMRCIFTSGFIAGMAFAIYLKFRNRS